MRIFCALLLLLPVPVTAQLALDRIFTDNMVLQRGYPIHLWGKGVPGSRVQVLFLEEQQQTSVRPDSTWSLSLKKQKASDQGLALIVKSGHETIKLKNILIGDVWLCLGQSNMEWPMVNEKHFHEEVAHTNIPSMRLYNPTYAGKNIYGKPFPDSILLRLNTEDFYRGHWETCDSLSIRTMSAVAYYFGKEIADHVGVPVGLMNLAVGGAPIESFIRRQALKSNPRFASKVQGNWLKNDSLPVWIRERGSQNVGHKVVFEDSIGPNHAYKPGFAFASGIAPIVRFPIKGIIWYQGESNSHEGERVAEHGDLLKLMVNDYRELWNRPDLPFYFVQLSSIDTVKYKGHLWPRFRDEQRLVLEKVRHSGMAVSSDIGARNDVHPRNKKDVGERLARWALHNTYHKGVLPSGPLPVRASYDNGRVTIHFQYADKKLQTSDGKPLRGFSFDGKIEAPAAIHQSTVVIPVDSRPDFVYYGWTPFTDSNLVNGQQLPASTFRIKVE